MHRPTNLTSINFPCAGINCRCNGYRSINQRSVPQLNCIFIHFGDWRIGFLFGSPAEEGDTFAEPWNHTLAEHRDIRGFTEFREPVPYTTV